MCSRSSSNNESRNNISNHYTNSMSCSRHKCKNTMITVVKTNAILGNNNYKENNNSIIIIIIIITINIDRNQIYPLRCLAILLHLLHLLLFPLLLIPLLSLHLLLVYYTIHHTLCHSLFAPTASHVITQCHPSHHYHHQRVCRRLITFVSRLHR